MRAKIIDGKKLAQRVREEIRSEVLRHRGCLFEDEPITLAVIQVGNDPASTVYVRNKKRACEEVGIRALHVTLEPGPRVQQDLLDTIEDFSCDDEVHGILVQLPLPPHVDKFAIFDAIEPCKDVDVFGSKNTGLLVQNRPYLYPCTPHAVREILVRSGIPIVGQKVVIINRSLVVGQPLANMLLQDHEFANATVTVCHEHTKNIKEIVRTADIVVTAVGNRENFVLTGDMIKPGATVIDVAIIRTENRLVGDSHESVWEVAGAVTPVPGGVGPLTICMLLKNTLAAYKYQKQL